VYGYVTATSNGSSTGTRWVNTGTIRNVRDLCGLPVTYTDTNNQTVTGTLAYGRLFRGEKLGSAAATELTNLGITTEYNVGDEYSNDTHLSDYHLNQVIHYDFDYNSGDENNPNSNYMKAWTAVTNIMTDIVNTSTTKNVYFHCRVGADRTGTLAYLLEGLLGVPDEIRYEEYELTYISGQYDRTRYYKEKTSTNNKKFVFMMDYVKTAQNIYDWYMSNSNASASLVQSFRTAMTVASANPQQQQQQVNSASRINKPVSDSLTKIDESAKKNTTSGNVSDSYSSPLGVSENSIEDDFSVSETQSLSATELAVVTATAVASGAAVSYVIAKNKKDEEGS
jgi:protein tyrosine/serine phosphatase